MTVDVADFLGVAGSPVGVTVWCDDASWVGPLRRLEALATWLTVEQHPCSTPPCPRVTVAADRPHGSVTFVGPIEGRQLEPFVELLRALATGVATYDTPATPQRLAGLDRDLAVRVAVTSSCPYCPSVAAAALRLACASPRVSVTIARAELLSGVTAAPTVWRDDVVVAQGPIGEYALVEQLLATS